MARIERAYCPRCGARLRRGQPVGSHCDPCLRAGPDPARDLPAGFFVQDRLRVALGKYHFGPVFLEVRAVAGWSQQRLAAAVGMTQPQISAIERGEHRLRDIETVAGVAHGLRIPGELLNFPGFGATVSTTGLTGRKDVSWVDRRDFGQHIAGLILGIAGATGLDTGRLLALLPQAEPTGTRHVGAADVEVIEALTAAFVRQDFAYGSGRVRDGAIAQLRSVLPLLDAQVPDELAPRLQLAAAALAMQAGWMSFDVLDHEAARRLWMIGLDIARNTDHPQADDLTTYLLYDMALQAMHLQRPDEARHLIRIGETAAVGRHPVSASTLGSLASIKARAHATQGDAAGCDRALGQAQEHITVLDPATTPPWGGHVSEVGLSARYGTAHYALALTDRDSRAAGQAVTLLRDGVERFGSGYARLGALYLPDLAGSHALAGDTDTAVTIGHHAIDAVTAVSSPRAHDRLRTLHTVLEPAHRSPGVVDLRERIAVTIAA